MAGKSYGLKEPPAPAPCLACPCPCYSCSCLSQLLVIGPVDSACLKVSRFASQLKSTRFLSQVPASVGSTCSGCSSLVVVLFLNLHVSSFLVLKT
mmetsp:Transcript_25040/g.82605  ORF Transcript_25040/g.82605 Transcript_25040/m.82605 type:complete len:95 (-) Transcript_25040:1335-1619(-)